MQKLVKQTLAATKFRGRRFQNVFHPALDARCERACERLAQVRHSNALTSLNLKSSQERRGALFGCERLVARPTTDHHGECHAVI